MVLRVKQAIRRSVQRLGYDIRRLSDVTPDLRRTEMIRRHGVDLVLDVGANRGQYARALRENGYTGHIVSFEPDPGTFKLLQEAFAADAHWSGHCAALGSSAGTAVLHVSQNSLCSSILDSESLLAATMPTAVTVDEILVTVNSLDGIWQQLVPEGSSVLLKLDVQGFERQVLDGAIESLPKITLLEMEMGMSPVYKGGSMIYDLLPHVHQLGFEALWIEGGFLDPVHLRLVDVDLFLARPMPPN